MKKRERAKRRALRREGVIALGITKRRESQRYQNRIALMKELNFLLVFWYIKKLEAKKIQPFLEGERCSVDEDDEDLQVCNYNCAERDLYHLPGPIPGH